MQDKTILEKANEWFDQKAKENGGYNRHSVFSGGYSTSLKDAEGLIEVLESEYQAEINENILTNKGVDSNVVRLAVLNRLLTQLQKLKK